MKVVFIGDDPQTAEFAGLSLRLRWPDTKPMVATTAEAGLDWVERESPEIVLIHPSFSDMSLADSIQALRGFSNVPLLVLGCQGSVESESASEVESVPAPASLFARPAARGSLGDARRVEAALGRD